MFANKYCSPKEAWMYFALSVQRMIDGGKGSVLGMPVLSNSVKGTF